jgi:spore maturation protein CgeB
LTELPGGLLVLYSDWRETMTEAHHQLSDADVAMVTSYCPDALAATSLVLDSPVRVRSFYDLDSGVTLDRLRAGQPVDYIGERGLADFDLVLSYNGGRAINELKSRLGARHVAPLYGHVDPSVHHPVPPDDRYRSDLSYLGTYSDDRQRELEMLFIEPARRQPFKKFVIGGSQYPGGFPWSDNIYFIPHVPPGEHAAFYSSSRLTLNVTRRPMAETGYCPSGRLFEAAACGVPLLTDAWEGLDYFFEPGVEILVARSSGEVENAMAMSDEAIARVARAGRERALSAHTARHRALQLESLLEAATALPVTTQS